MSQYDTTFDLKINVGHCDLYFMVQWFCLISWRLFNVWTSYFRIMSQYDPTFDLKINVGHFDLYFMVQWFCPISWRLFDIWTPYLGIMSQYDPTFDLRINVGHCDLYFMVQWFLPYVLKTVWYMNFILQDYESVWPDIWPKTKCWSLWPIYFMVQWFCLTSWRLFAAWTSYFRIMSQYDTKFDLKINRSLWPIFHSPVILLYILKTIWYMNTILWDYESVWPMFDLKINVGHCDLNFNVKWVCLISWKLFSSWTSYFETMSHYDLTSDL